MGFLESTLRRRAGMKPWQNLGTWQLMLAMQLLALQKMPAKPLLVLQRMQVSGLQALQKTPETSLWTCSEIQSSTSQCCQDWAPQYSGQIFGNALRFIDFCTPLR